MDAARELFAHRGLDVGFDEIARVAGVGVGTVYRRFPDRAALVEALFSERADDVVADAAAALAVSDPWQAVVVFCEQTIIERQRDRGLAEVLASGEHDYERLDELREQMGTIVGELLERAQRAGVVRADLDPLDLAVITHLLGTVADDGGAEIWRRYLSLFFDAIRARPDVQPLAGPAPTVENVEGVAKRL